MISDLHLADETPSLTDFALEWLNRAIYSHAPSHIWVLGDLFDAWVGDDQISLSETAQRVAHTLRDAQETGIQIGLMRGNRDFLLGATYAQACGASLLPDEWVGPLPDGTPTVVCHGDSLCLDDTEYLAFREQTRAPEWQQAFLAQTLEQRLSVARQIRAQSEAAKAGKSMEIMDIRLSAAVERLKAMGCSQLIHGHTHRPGHSPLGGDLQRWVLPDWMAPGSGHDRSRGGGLLLSQSGIQALGVFS